MVNIDPYLIFDGEAKEAFDFYKSVFGGEFIEVKYYKDMDDTEEIDELDLDRIMHISLAIGDGIVLIGSDTTQEMMEGYVPGNNVSLFIDADSNKEATRIFTELSEDGVIDMLLEEHSHVGMFTDRYGIQWIVSYHEGDEIDSHEEEV